MNTSERRVRALREGVRHGAGRPWYRIQNAADDNGPPEVWVYDEIDPFWGMSAEVFARDLAAIDADEITVRINSPGGSVFDGIAIMNSLKGHRARITAMVDGLAASAASFVAMAADDIVMMPHAEMMIHDASGVVLGNAEDMTRMAADLERVSANIASIYAERAGGDAEQWRAAMRRETWYSAEEAVTAGLADRLGDDPTTETESTTAHFDLSIYNYAGRRAAPAPRIPSPARAEANKKRGPHMSLNTDIAQRLGLAEDANEATILAAIDEALDERATDEDQDEAEPGNTAPALPEGVVAIDAATLAELQNRAARGDAARAEQEREARARAIDDAVRTGRIAPSQRAAWTARLETDPAEAAVLASLSEVYPVGAEIGHAGTDNDTASDDVYAALFGKES